MLTTSTTKYVLKFSIIYTLYVVLASIVLILYTTVQLY
eukprot:SAG11_NODE_17267_length_523_cov_1.313679_2_plen_37_part_01